MTIEVESVGIDRDNESKSLRRRMLLVGIAHPTFLAITSSEEQLWQGYQYLEHIVRMAKARAFLKLKESRVA